MRKAVWRQHAAALLAFIVLAGVETWPLPLKLGTHLTGSPTGDTGVYVWNLWIFSHRVLSVGATPLSTLKVLPLGDDPVDLSLHNYTVFSDVLALPLLNWLGVVATFNVVYLFNAGLAGFGAYLLARRLTGRALESFVAGLMFAWSPFLVTRGLAHFSLAAAAPLPFFMLALHRAWDTQRLRDAVLAGVTLAWAAASDPYYGVYGVMLGAVFLGSRLVAVRFVRRPIEQLRAARHLLDVGIVAVTLLVMGVHVVAGGTVQLGVFRLSMHTLFTPMLVLTTLVLTRVAVAMNLRIAPAQVPSRGFLLRATLAGGVVAAAMMSPTLYAMGMRAVTGDVASVPVLWRSSAPGVDLLALFLPNPNHPLAPRAWFEWLSAGPGGYLDQVGSLSLVGLAVMAAAWRWAGFRPPRFWLVVTIGFVLLALGPFVQAGRLNTGIPTPWTLLRYAPVIGSARMPARFMVVVTLGFSVLLAFALASLSARFPRRRLVLTSAVGVLLAAELAAAPRTLYSAAVPTVFQIVAADPRPVRVLELPTGIRDGLSSMGDFSAQAQFNQTFHGKGLRGGYLPASRHRSASLPPDARHVGALRDQRATSPPARGWRAVVEVPEFLRATNLGYVVMNRARVSDDLRDFAILLLGLTRIAEVDGYELYVPAPPRAGRPLPPRAP
jgi:hypothetical protein